MRGQKIVVLGTGGTIAGTAAAADDNIGYTAAQVGVEQLLHAMVPAARSSRGRMMFLKNGFMISEYSG